MREMWRSPRRWLQVSTVALGVVAVVLTVLTAINRLTDSDAMGTLLVSSSIASHGTPILDGYFPDILRSLGDRVTLVGAHPAYAFPLGTPLICVPIAWVLQRAGVDVLAHDHQVQIGLAALASALTLVLLYLLARRFRGHWTSLGLALAFWFGTPLASTNATALWSQDFGSALALGALLLLVLAMQRCLWAAALLLGVDLVLMITTRPQLAPLAFAVVVVLGVTWWRGALATIATSFAGLLGFVGLNETWFGTPLPAYYAPERLAGGEFWTALAGNLVSPGRGLLVYVPMILSLAVLAWVCRGLPVYGGRLIVMTAGWVLMHVVLISRFPHWWGGWGFGPRLMADVLPGLFLVVVLLWPPHLTQVRNRVAVAIFASLAAVSIWINTAQGLYNPYTRFWYIEPNVDQSPQMLWDWSYPQFLASEQRHEDRLADLTPAPPALSLGSQVPVGAPSLALIGWSTGFASPGISLDRFRFGTPELLKENGRRWSEGKDARIAFTLDETAREAAIGELALSVESLGRQRVEMFLNGAQVYSGILLDGPAMITAQFNPHVLGASNDLRISLPDAVSVGQASDFRELAIALKAFRLQ